MIEYAMANLEYYRARAARTLETEIPNVFQETALVLAECNCYEYQLSLRSFLIGSGLR